ncbi:unnamed protein product, partial [marine sediment metagenome]
AHDKFTALEARQACKLDGTLYWSCPGNHFDGVNPDVDNILKQTNGILKVSVDGRYLIAAVFLPSKAKVSGAIVYGNAGAGDEIWILRRITLLDGTSVDMATQSINTEDITINNADIDNSLYAYWFMTHSLDTNDEIYGALIVYTL